eukprot:TRINITY_DN730_c2_g1_i1.p1 TRINITY_DN730_c2_g1~~TRINITY_DN730_c2_g1_i1.p1  ORF type:complete len:121 (-),score=18.13 TRINITY_DN730_c2_g1_i1:83-418(-)
MKSILFLTVLSLLFCLSHGYINATLTIEKNSKIFANLIPGTTALNLLQLENKLNLSWFPTLGYLLNSIDGYNCTAPQYWQFYLNSNGKIHAGLANYVLFTNDVVLLKCETP